MKGGGAAADMAGMMMGMNIANEMMKNMNNTPKPPAETQPEPAAPAGNKKNNFCPNCCAKNEWAYFCPNCGQKLN